MAYHGHLSATARLLGFAGLLPQLLAALLIATRIDPALGTIAALAYAVTILSFIGGIWWGMAMRAGEIQSSYAAVAVVPTLVGFLVVIARVLGVSVQVALVAVGVLLFLTLLVDRRLVARGLTPPGWMTLRVPLSLGLGSLTVLAGVLSPSSVNIIYSN